MIVLTDEQKEKAIAREIARLEAAVAREAAMATRRDIAAAAGIAAARASESQTFSDWVVATHAVCVATGGKDDPFFSDDKGRRRVERLLRSAKTRELIKAEKKVWLTISKKLVAEPTDDQLRAAKIATAKQNVARDEKYNRDADVIEAIRGISLPRLQIKLLDTVPEAS
ncbi:MAG: hypothetical protein ACREQ5_06865 [Candidatus Dormibacteria bacterium]